MHKRRSKLRITLKTDNAMLSLTQMVCDLSRVDTASTCGCGISSSVIWYDIFFAAATLFEDMVVMTTGWLLIY